MISPIHSPNRCNEFNLIQLVRDGLTDDQASCMEEHLEFCSECREKLDSIWDLAFDEETGLSAAISSNSVGDQNEMVSSIRDSLRLLEQTLGDFTSHTAATYLPWLKPISRDTNTVEEAIGETTKSTNRFIGILDSYPVVRILGQGGMGTVLEAWDAELHRPIAIKVMHPHLASIGIARQRFIREARCAASIVHPNVIAIHQIHAEHSPPYFIMPLILGESLQQRIERLGCFPVDQSLRIAAQVADGLAAAEKQGLVHRDVKPANILLERGTDRALLTDFGLVRALHEATITLSGSIAGTPQYMSPEQAKGESLDPKTDLYSLGGVLYSMLTGHAPFEAEAPLALVRKIAESDPKPLSHFDPAIPRSVQILVEWLMQRDKRKRPASALVVAQVATEIHANLLDPQVHHLPYVVKRLMVFKRWQSQFSAILFGCFLFGILGTAAAAPFIGRWFLSPPRVSTGRNPTQLETLRNRNESDPITDRISDGWVPPHTSFDVEFELQSLSHELSELENEAMNEFRDSVPNAK